ncbi:MAG TPA: hypothetical protein VFB12_00950 [Ktedonobacteraceae bacterium]|nr:hypothetical protein [Ktedonobacteraceae bacterium]
MARRPTIAEIAFEAGVSLPTVRHSMALLAYDVHPKLVQELLGHNVFHAFCEYVSFPLDSAMQR